MTGDTGAMMLAILPELGLVVLAGVILAVDALRRDRKTDLLAWLTAGGLVVIAVLAALFARPAAEPVLLWGGALRLDGSGFIFRMIFLMGAALTALFSVDNEALRERGEYYALLVVSTLGMSLMASAADLITLYLAIETTSIPLYVLAGFMVRDPKSVEAGVKYLVFGALTSAVMLYGFSLLYGFTGTTQLYDMAAALVAEGQYSPAVIGALVLSLAGFGFKISAVPFHFWAPDVYEGAPTPVAGFLSTASKAAGFAVLLRVLSVVFADNALVWSLLVAVLATASMFVGNLLALAQKNIKRLLAYSSIAQAGYVLIGVAANNQLGTSGAVYYLLGYLFTNLAAFGIVTLVGRKLKSDEISAYAGLSRRAPGLALAMLVALLSLGGIPPFAGFFGKLLVFGAAIDANMLWLAILGIINSIIALYYYLTVLKVIYLYRSDGDTQKLAFGGPWAVALVICVAAVLVLGVVFAPWYNLAGLAAASLL